MRATQAASSNVAPLALTGLTARGVVLKLRRPIVARIATITEWPVILIDLHTDRGITGRSYLEPTSRRR